MSDSDMNGDTVAHRVSGHFDSDYNVTESNDWTMAN